MWLPPRAGMPRCLGKSIQVCCFVVVLLTVLRLARSDVESSQAPSTVYFGCQFKTRCQSLSTRWYLISFQHLSPSVVMRIHIRSLHVRCSPQPRHVRSKARKFHTSEQPCAHSLSPRGQISQRWARHHIQNVNADVLVKWKEVTWIGCAGTVSCLLTA